MGKLVEQKIPTLFGGVSRQPPSVRQLNQVQEMDNALPSVVTGGFEKRPPTQVLAKLSFLSASADYGVHEINRDATEQTFLFFGNDTIKAVNAINGAEITVNIGDSTRHFLIDQSGINSTGVVEDDDGTDVEVELEIGSGETQFDWEWTLTDSSTVFNVEGSADGAVWNSIQTGITGATSGTFSTTIGAVVANDHNYIRVNITTGAGTADDEISIKATFKDVTYLKDADPEDIRAVSVADNTFVVNRNITTRRAPKDTGTITAAYQTFSDLDTAVTPGAPTLNNVYRISGDDTDGFGTYFVKVVQPTGTSSYVFEEVAHPTQANEFDESSMPHRIVRETDGTFTFKAADWDARGAGDDTVSEAPEFIGKTINEIQFFKNRLVLISDENVTTGQAADAFNFWPEKAVDVLDTDPVSRGASTTSVNILEGATVFRKILFVTSRNAQFEMTSNAEFTPTTAVFDQATTYAAATTARPASMGDVLYFAANCGCVSSVIYEYFFDDSSLSNTAADVTKHASGYLQADVLKIAPDSSTSTVFVLSSAEQNAVFVYRTFFDANEKLQSAWAKYTFGATESDAFIHGLAVFSGFLVLVIERDDGNIYLEQMPIERELQDSVMGFTPFLDQREVLTGSYDSGTGLTTWTTTYGHQDEAQVILGPTFSNAGQELTVNSYPSGTTLTAVGDYSSGQCYVGRPYEMDVELSRFFMRDNLGTILNGELKVGTVSFEYADTGFLEIESQLPGRPTKTVKFEGKNLGDEELVVGASTIRTTGVISAKINSRSEGLVVKLKNDKPQPCVITAATWMGFFNEISRQE